MENIKTQGKELIACGSKYLTLRQVELVFNDRQKTKSYIDTFNHNQCIFFTRDYYSHEYNILSDDPWNHKDRSGDYFKFPGTYDTEIKYPYHSLVKKTVKKTKNVYIHWVIYRMRETVTKAGWIPFTLRESKRWIDSAFMEIKYECSDKVYRTELGKRFTFDYNFDEDKK